MQIIIFVLVIIGLLDIYAFQAIKIAQLPKILWYLYWFLNSMLYITIISMPFYNIRYETNPIKGYFIGVFIGLLLFKLIVVLFLGFDDIRRLFMWLYFFYQKKVTASPNLTPQNSIYISRSQFLSYLGLIIGSLPMITLLYGMIRNPYRYNVVRQKLNIANLPSVFENFKIVQISDIHSGSFTAHEPIKKAIELINNENADAIFFTGDLVNYKASEIVPYKDIFSQLSSKLGVFSVLGNHDYGDYVDWQSKDERNNNLQTLKNEHKQLGWDLLLNEHRIIEKDNHKLAIIGVENWSAHRHFPRHGNLQAAYEGCQDAHVQLLLSHDPSHWQAQVIPNYPQIHATFAGHTHGMQFGINMAGMQWSPVQYAYKEWIGLYKHHQQQLYVNAGFGFLAYPGRVGFLPEITVFELQKA